MQAKNIPAGKTIIQGKYPRPITTTAHLLSKSDLPDAEFCLCASRHEIKGIAGTPIEKSIFPNTIDPLDFEAAKAMATSWANNELKGKMTVYVYVTGLSMALVEALQAFYNYTKENRIVRLCLCHYNRIDASYVQQWINF